MESGVRRAMDSFADLRMLTEHPLSTISSNELRPLVATMLSSCASRL